MIDHIYKQAKNLDVYLAPAIFSTPDGHKENVRATNVIWIEIDGKLPSHEQLAKLNITIPNLQIQTSSESHQHWYWRLDEPLVEVDSIDLFNKSLTYVMEGADSSGWDANQVLRIPGTNNYKYNLPSFIVGRNNSTAISNSNLCSLPPPPVVSVDINITKLPDITEILLTYPLPKDAIKLYLTQSPPQGECSTYLVRLAYHCAELGMKNEEIFSVIYNADERWDKFKGRSDRNTRLIEIINHCRIKFPEKKKEAPANRLTVVGAFSLVKSDRKLEWIIPGLLESKGSLLLTGPGGVGKTQFSLNLAIAMALGQQILNFSIAKQSKILFASLEMGWEQLQSFLATMTKSLPASLLHTLEENLLCLPLGESLPLNISDGQKLFNELIEEHKPDGFIIDSLGSAISGDLTSRENVQPYLDWNDKLRNQHGIFSWVIHHHRKGNGQNARKPNTLDDVYGDVYITNRATTVYCLWPTKRRDTIEAIPLKLRLAEKPNNWFIRRNPDLTFEQYNMKADGMMNSPLIIEGGTDKPPQGMNGSKPGVISI